MPTSVQRRKGGSTAGLTNLANASARFTVILSQTGTLAARAGFGAFRAPFPCVLETLDMAVQSLGGTSGATSVDVNLATAPGSDAATILVAPFSLAYNAANLFLTKVPSCAPLVVGSGNVISADVDAVPGTASAGLTVSLVLRATHVAS